MSETPVDIPATLRRHGLRPDKSLGQNFLIDPNALALVIASAEIHSNDTVLEVGAGLGSLTRLLAAAAGRVVAVEIDPDLVHVLRREIGAYANIELVQGDIMRLDSMELVYHSSSKEKSDLEPPYLVVANIPYYITSSLIRHLLEADQPPSRIVLTIQAEVAERICALPGDMSILAVSVQVYGNPSIKGHIPASAFYPVPQVDSAVVRIDLYKRPLIPQGELNEFFRLVKAGFSQKRKTLRNAISGGMHWSPHSTSETLVGAGIEPNRRAETLSLDEWLGLYAFWKAHPDY